MAPIFEANGPNSVFFSKKPQMLEYLPSHLSLLTASLITTTVPTQNPTVCKSVSHRSEKRRMGQKKKKNEDGITLYF